MDLHIKNLSYSVIKAVCFYITFTSCLIGQQMDFDNRKFEYNLDSLDVWKFEVDYEEVLILRNYGVNNEYFYDNYKYIGAAHWSNEEVINNKLGDLKEYLDHNGVAVAPFVFDKIFLQDRATRFSYDYTYDINIDFINNIINSLKKKIGDSLPEGFLIEAYELEKINKNQLKEKLYFRGRKKFEKIFNNETDLSIFMKNNTKNNITIVPVFIQKAYIETKTTSLYVQIRVYDYDKLLFTTSTNLNLNWQSFRQNNYNENLLYFNSVSEILLHQILF